MKNISVLFFSQQPPSNILELVKALPFVEVHTAFPNVGDMAEIFKVFVSHYPRVVIIDGHYGDADMQYFGEISAKEKAGLDLMRMRLSQKARTPESIKLMTFAKDIRPDIKVVFLLYKVPGENLAQVLKERGASVILVNNQKSSDITDALTKIIGSLADIGTSVKRNFATMRTATGKLHDRFSSDNKRV